MLQKPYLSDGAKLNLLRFFFKIRSEKGTRRKTNIIISGDIYSLITHSKWSQVKSCCCNLFETSLWLRSKTLKWEIKRSVIKFIQSILKSLVILAMWLALSIAIYSQIALSFAVKYLFLSQWEWNSKTKQPIRL